ncbi:hypothetical protein [Comamonas sp. lk]|uniref:hypothetical protein n=1 Tax=Comamonas sp. lk TaxID=2201272 RepID=UPI0013CF050A|nr:hypothetical protein [Comamonas sp. lk]
MKKINWALLEQVTSSIQNIVVVIASIAAGFWAISTFYSEGKNLSGSEIKISANPLKLNNLVYLDIGVEVSGVDRKGYHYNFDESTISVVKFNGSANDKEFSHVLSLTPTFLHVDAENNVVEVVSLRTHVTSFSVKKFSSIVPIPGDGIYVVNFSMPQKGVLDGMASKSNSRIKYKEKYVDPDFRGESRSVTVVVDNNLKK